MKKRIWNFSELAGKKFGKLTVISFAYVKNEHSYWLCKCECGNKKIIRGSNVKKGIGCNCGYRKKRKRLFDLTEQNFGRLTVISFAYKKNGINYWKCICKCGSEKIVLQNNLKCGRTKSCGCLQKENLDKYRVINKEKCTKHNMRYTRFYNIWCCMKVRCNNKNNKHYGGRGIIVCNRWLEFINFRDDMYKFYQEHCEKYSIKQTTIERTNNNGNYELSNCYWATYKEQANNKRNNIK